MRAKRLTVLERKEIFRALVDAQDSGLMNVPESIRHVCSHFKISEDQLRLIQEEGLQKEWPPLDESSVLAG